MANVTGASLNPIFERLRNAPTYHPLEADTFADWSIEAGDLVTVTRDGKSYQSPVHSTKINWNKKQKVTISSTGNEKRDSVAKMSQRKFRGGSGGLRSSQNSYRLIETSYNNMRAGLELASSSAALYVDDAYRRMRSGLNLTSSSASLYVDDAYNKMRAGLNLTSSSAALYVDDSYNKMKSGLALTSSSAALYVDSRYNQMRSGLDVTMSSATLYAQSRTTRAFIMTRINADGEGEALIQADKVSITGSTTINGTMKVEDDALVVKKPAVFQGNIFLQTNGSSLKIGSGTALQFLGTATYELDNTTVKTMLKTFSVNGDTLTLTRFDGTYENFRKAVTPTLSGSWSNGTLTVTSSPAPGQNFVQSLVQKAASWNGLTVTVPIYAQWGSSGQYEEDTGRSVVATCPITNDAVRLSNCQSTTTRPTGTSLASWRNAVADAVNNRKYLIFEAYIDGVSGATKKYYIDFE